MNRSKRVTLARAALSGYANGPDATRAARTRALESMAGSSVVVVVEGVSDQIAVETLAIRQGRDLQASGVTVLPAGGASEMVKLSVASMSDSNLSSRLVYLCDEAEEPVVRRGLHEAGSDAPWSGAESEIFVRVEDLEDELIRASGLENVVAVIESQGDLRSLERLQLQPAWRDRPLDLQLRRFMGSGSRRKLRYARLLAGSIDLDRVPSPLRGLLDAM